MLLVVNAGSSSIKLAVFDATLRAGAGGVCHRDRRRGAVERSACVAQDCAAADHRAALALAFEEMAAQGVALGDLTAAAHRVVHGGAGFGAARAGDCGGDRGD